MEEKELKDSLHRTNTLLQAVSEGFAHFQGQVEQQIKENAKNIERLEKMQETTMVTVNKLVAKLSNGINDRVDYIENSLQKNVSREEFNGAMKNIRLENAVNIEDAIKRYDEKNIPLFDEIKNLKARTTILLAIITPILTGLIVLIIRNFFMI